MKRLGLFLLSSALLVSSVISPAQAETVVCTAIDSLPYTITTQGVYCLTGHLNTGITSGNAIEITTNNVVLDLNGFKLGGLAAGPGTNAVGIYALNRQNITIKNGTIRGFVVGIFLDDNLSQGHVVEDIRADQNTYTGIRVHGSGNIVRNNQVVATGGSTINSPYMGIVVFGNDSRVLNNDVINTGGGTGPGIFLQSTTGALVVNNRITTADAGIVFALGTGKYRDNLTFDVPTANRFIGGTDAGNNN